MNFLLWGAIYLFIACCVWAFGYLTASREFGKEVRFYKDCIKNQRTVLQAQNSDHLKTLEEYQVAEKGLQLWVEAKIDMKSATVAKLPRGTLTEAFERGEKFGYQAVLLHLKGYL